MDKNGNSLEDSSSIGFFIKAPLLKKIITFSLFSAIMVLSGCGGSESDHHPVVAPPPPKRPVIVSPAYHGTPKLKGMTARNLFDLLGRPDQDMDEAWARRLQFLAPSCVLDVYLYPPRQGEEMVVRHVDARDLHGNDFNQDTCIAALMQQPHTVHH
ncbi:MAG: hypothetical protein ABF461_03255 [Zymomonas mobilis subsp. pomaceae]|uniref:hypothetical protein n=1 Tax=Zymomonas mobilis TaxID=542 RepID=UPI0039EA4029